MFNVYMCGAGKGEPENRCASGWNGKNLFFPWASLESPADTPTFWRQYPGILNQLRSKNRVSQKVRIKGMQKNLWYNFQDSAAKRGSSKTDMRTILCDCTKSVPPISTSSPSAPWSSGEQSSLLFKPISTNLWKAKYIWETLHQSLYNLRNLMCVKFNFYQLDSTWPAQRLLWKNISCSSTKYTLLYRVNPQLMSKINRVGAVFVFQKMSQVFDNNVSIIIGLKKPVGLVLKKKA